MENQRIETVILGTGQLGLAIMDELCKDGVPVKLVNRSGRVKTEEIPSGVVIEAADVTDPDQVERVCQGAKVVFFCVQPAYHRWPTDFPPLVDAVIEGVSRTGGKIAFGSNVYLYGDPDGKPIIESLPHAAHTIKGGVRVELAKRFMEADRTGKVDVVIGRASDFYGPRVKMSGYGDLLFEAALNGTTADLLGDIDQPHTITYIRDFARAMVNLSRLESAYGQAWHVPSAAAGSTRNFVTLIEDEVGRPVNTRVAGRLMLRLISLFNPNAREMVELLYEFEKPFVIDHSKYTAAFPNHLPTPLEQGIQETLSWYKTQQEG